MTLRITEARRPRTTLDIEDDVLTATKELACRQGVSSGLMISQLLRRALTGQGEGESASDAEHSADIAVAGFRPLPAGSSIATNDDVNRLRDVEGV